MKEKQIYVSPESESIEVVLQGCIAGSADPSFSGFGTEQNWDE